MNIELRCVPKPRMTKADAWKKRHIVCNYWLFSDKLRLACKAFELHDSYSATFYFAMPARWSKKKRIEMIGKAHQDRPDIDNCIKSIQDVLRPGDDQMIYSVHAMKMWAERDCIVLENRI